MGGGGGRPASGSLVHATDLGRAPEEMVVVRGQEGMLALFLWQNNARPIFPLFGLIVSLVRLIITAVERIFPLVLIAPLQSPWSSVTQGPFVLRVSNKRIPCDLELAVSQACTVHGIELIPG